MLSIVSGGRSQLGLTDEFGMSKKQGQDIFRVNIRLIRNFEFKLNTCMHNTINEFGFHKLSFVVIAFNISK